MNILEGECIFQVQNFLSSFYIMIHFVFLFVLLPFLISWYKWVWFIFRHRYHLSFSREFMGVLFLSLEISLSRTVEFLYSMFWKKLFPCFYTDLIFCVCRILYFCWLCFLFSFFFPPPLKISAAVLLISKNPGFLVLFLNNKAFYF